MRANPLPPYIRCRTCGKYLSPQEVVLQRYCSQACAARFTSCANCGKYFEAGRDYQERYCSQPCSVQYKLNRIFGPEPVMVLVEE